MPDVTKTPVPAAITTSSSVEAGIGNLEFTDGYPTRETAERLRDHLNYLHGVDTFMNTMQGVSIYTMRKGGGGEKRTAHPSSTSPAPGPTTSSPGNWIHTDPE